MRMPRTFFFATLTLTFALAIWAMLRARDASRLQRAAAAATHRAAQLESQVQRAVQRAEAAEHRKADPAGPSALPIPASAAPGPRVEASNDEPATPQDIVRDPVVRAAYLREFRTQLDGTWGLLFQRLHLPSDRLEKFKDLLTRFEEKDLAVEAEASQRRLSLDSPEIVALEDGLNEQIKSEIKILLGRDDYRTYREYNQDRHVLPIIDQLVRTSDSTALSLDSAYQFMRLLSENSQRKSSGTVIEDTIDWEKTMTLAPAILTPDQLAALTTIRDKARAEKQQDDLFKKLVIEFEQKWSAARAGP